jgi:hypothetical protein
MVTWHRHTSPHDAVTTANIYQEFITHQTLILLKPHNNPVKYVVDYFHSAMIKLVEEVIQFVKGHTTSKY